MVVYNNPIVLQRADPWVLKVDGEYYFTASDPEYNCIAIRHASSINDLQKAPETVVCLKESLSGILHSTFFVRDWKTERATGMYDLWSTMQKHCGMKVRTKPVCCLVRIGRQNPMHKPDLQNN